MTQANTLETPGWGHELRATLTLAVPLAATNLLQMLIHAVDVIFIARLGDTPLAASSLGIAIFGLTLWAMTGLIGACAPLIAAERGRKLHSVRDIRRTVRMGMWVAVLFGLVGMGIAFAGEWLLLASGQEPAIAAIAGDFLFVIAFAMIPMILAGVFRIFVARARQRSAERRPRRARSSPTASGRRSRCRGSMRRAGCRRGAR